MADIEVAIGALRWPVMIARRRQNFEAGGTGIFEDFVAIQIVHADIQPTGALTFYGAEQVDTPVTHRITLRWLDYLDQTNVILRSLDRPDGSPRTEIFRIRRVKELNGRKRFTSIEAELERVVSQSLGNAQ